MVKKLLLLVSLVLLYEFQSASGRAVSKTHSSNTIEGCRRQKSSEGVEVYVTVSSLSVNLKTGETVNRQLEINWNGRIPRVGDKVALYNKNPWKNKKHAKPILEVDPTNHLSGYFRTNVTFPEMYFNLNSLADEPCLGFWVAYFIRGKMVSSSCLQTRPFWMQKNRQYLERQTLADIMIPGSHDSGCFCPDDIRSIDTLTRYKYAQEEPIFNQLVYGLRYFDFRVGFYNSTKEKFFINHFVFRTAHSVESILKEIRAFLDATQEIIIIDFHLFPMGFSELEVHLELMKIIYMNLNPYIIPYNSAYREATLAELWASGKRILVSYNNAARHHEPHGVFWPGILRAWGNKQRPEDLKTYFEKVYSKPLPRELWASMAELTPNTSFIMIHPRTGLRILADEINRNVTEWFRDKYWQGSNIVATDYFLGNNMIDVAIETNKLRSLCLKHVR